MSSLVIGFCQGLSQLWLAIFKGLVSLYFLIQFITIDFISNLQLGPINQVIVSDQPFQHSLCLCLKQGAYLRVEHLNSCFTRVGSGFSHKHQTSAQCCKSIFARNLRIFVVSQSVCKTRLTMLASDKHSSILREFVNYRQKSSITLTLGWKGLPGTNTLAYWAES